MKYINNKIVCGALSMLTLLGTTSCGEDFLKEDAGHLYTDALLELSKPFQYPNLFLFLL